MTDDRAIQGLEAESPTPPALGIARASASAGANASWT